MMICMTRSERNSLVAILTAIVLVIGGIVAAVVLGVRGPDDGQDLVARAAETPTATAEAAGTADTTVEETPDPLADARLNRVTAGPAPAATDSWGGVEHVRSWEGEFTVWRGGLPQIILGPAGNWFPAGQPGCGDGVYLVEFAGVDKQSPLQASLVDATGVTTHEAEAAAGWMLLDDCHLPYLTLEAGGEVPQVEVTYEVHEYQPAG